MTSMRALTIPPNWENLGGLIGLRRSAGRSCRGSRWRLLVTGEGWGRWALFVVALARAALAWCWQCFHSRRRGFRSDPYEPWRRPRRFGQPQVEAVRPARLPKRPRHGNGLPASAGPRHARAGALRRLVIPIPCWPIAHRSTTGWERRRARSPRILRATAWTARSGPVRSWVLPV